MGSLKEFSCECGYKKVIPVGIGKKSIDRDCIKKTFPEQTGMDDTALRGFRIEKIPGMCINCRDLVGVLCLVSGNGEEADIVSGKCETCGAPVERIFYKKQSVCPLCRRKLNETECGLWD